MKKITLFLCMTFGLLINVIGSQIQEQTSLLSIENNEITISQNEVVVGAASNSNVSVEVTSQKPFYVICYEDWLTYKTNKNPLLDPDKETLTIEATRNPFNSSRTGIVRVYNDTGGEQLISVVQTGNVLNYLEITENQLTIDASNDSIFQIKIQTNTTWTTTSNQSWLTLSKSSGTGNGTIGISAATNPLASKREAIVSISNGSITKSIHVTQWGQTQKELEVSTINVQKNFYWDDSTKVNITSNTKWTAVSNNDWLIVSPASGSNNGSIFISIENGYEETSRKGTITITGTGATTKTITVNLSMPDDYYITVPQTEYTVSTSGFGLLEIPVSSNTFWTAWSNFSDVVYTPSNGFGNNTLYLITKPYVDDYDAEVWIEQTENDGDIEPILLNINVKGQNNAHIEPDAVNASIAAEGNSSAYITVYSDLIWTASSNQAWLTIDNPTHDGFGQIMLSAAANTSSKMRFATITLSAIGYSAKTVIVSQFGNGIETPKLETLTPNLEVNAANGSTRIIEVVSNLNWTATSNQAWLTLSQTSGSNDGSIIITATANNTNAPRQAFVTLSANGVSSETITVTQAAAITTYTLAVSNKNVGIAAPVGSTASVNITSNTAWTATSNQSWLTINPASGSNNGMLTFTAAGNTASTTRQATVTVSGTGVSSETITVTQAAAITTYTLAVSNRNVGIAAPAGSTASVNITSNTAWTAISNQSWLTINPASGSNNGMLTFTAAENTASTTRQATVTVSGTGVSPVTITVTQAAATSILIVDEGSNNIIIGSDSSTTTTVNIQSNTSWTATSNQSWLKVSPASGTNNGKITISADTNTLDESRQGIITITANGITITITITQTGSNPNYSLAVSNKNVGIAALTGSTSSVNITSNTAWTATSNQSWLTINPASGNNNGVLTFTAAENTASTTRQATVTVSGTGVSSENITVTQAAASILIVDEGSSNITIGPESGTTITISIQSNTSWTATSNQSWLKVSPASGTNNGAVTVNAEPNQLADDRQGTITITANGVSITIVVTQTGSVDNMVNVTFRVDLTYVDFDFDEFFITGTFNDWGERILMTAEGKIMTTTLKLPKNKSFQYKYLYTNNGTEYWDEVKGDCTTNDNWKNRIVNVSDNDMVLDLVYYGLCNHDALTALAGPDQEVNGGETVYLSGNYMGAFNNTAINYEWHAPEGIVLSSSTNQNPTFSAPSSNINAYYVLLLYVSSGALTSAPDEVTILVKKSTSSVEDHASKADMRVYPNPNSGVFEIDLGLYGESCQLTIFNSIGAKIHQAIMNQTGKVFIDIKNHKRGVYFVNVKNDKINQTRQIVIR